MGNGARGIKFLPKLLQNSDHWVKKVDDLWRHLANVHKARWARAAVTGKWQHLFVLKLNVSLK